INTSTTIALDKISSVAINANNQFEISLDTTLTKYTISAYTNVELNSNKLIIKNLNYFNLISISDTNLNSLRSSIQDYITNNQVTVDNVNNHITNINNLVSSAKTTDNQNLGNFVGLVTYSNNAFTIPLNSNCKMNVKSLSNIQVNVNSIVMSNFNFHVVPVGPQESPEDWFTWNGNQIIGLTNLGKQQKEIVLPSKATSITNNVFDKNKIIESVDMSLTSITSIPDGSSSGNNGNGLGLFCTAINLISISLPPSLTSIGSVSFFDCTSLTSITIPNSVTTIGYGAFNNCTSLTSITIPNSVTTIGDRAFQNCRTLTSITIPNSLTIISAFIFAGCRTLASITIPNSVTTIYGNAFSNCTSLTSITMPNSVTTIGNNAFLNVPTTCVMIIKKGWNRQLAINTGWYKGSFVEVD
ncbi:MAG: leucine-rich repeat domain-containing protein, partial [Ureaplasma sp.]|nr:leucine-rich repeat domain-containing protein [Ureaplasma sp.]